MSKPFKQKMISANDLLEGGVVYLTEQGGWTRLITEAAIAGDEAAAEALLARANQPGKVVGAYLFDVTLNNGEVQPDHFRERFRETGPTLHANFARHRHLPTPLTDVAEQGNL
jgi:hypothetical protein